MNYEVTVEFCAAQSLASVFLSPAYCVSFANNEAAKASNKCINIRLCRGEGQPRSTLKCTDRSVDEKPDQGISVAKFLFRVLVTWCQ